jgi:protein TonB
MPSSSHATGVLSCRSLLGGQRKEVMASIIIHAIVLFLLFWTSVTTTTIIPHVQIIQVSLEQQETSPSNSRKGRKQITDSQVNPAQNQITKEAPAKLLTVQKEVFRENIVSERQDMMNPVLPGEHQVIASSSSKEEAVGAIYAGNQSDNKTKAAVASRMESRGTAETQFGHIGAPQFIHREMPVYPMLARRLGKEGKVILKLLIDMNGNLKNVEVVEAAGFGFTEAAVAAVKNSTYAPASRNGEKITTAALLPVRFYLQ